MLVIVIETHVLIHAGLWVYAVNLIVDKQVLLRGANYHKSGISYSDASNTGCSGLFKIISYAVERCFSCYFVGLVNRVKVRLVKK